MKPAEVEELDAEVYGAFVRYMQREAAEVERASKARR
jgi:hypothetical protein